MHVDQCICATRGRVLAQEATFSFFIVTIRTVKSPETKSEDHCKMTGT